MHQPNLNYNMNTDAEIVPFGKYTGQPVETLLADSDYLQWVKGQPGLMRTLETRHPVFFNIIVTGGPETEDTPDHNALQLRFLDRAFQLAFLEAATSKSAAAYNAQLLKTAQQNEEESCLIAVERATAELKEAKYYREEWQHILSRAEEALRYPLTLEEPKCFVKFECGYDVNLRICLWYECLKWDPNSFPTGKLKDAYLEKEWNFQIELKPQVGDNFPSVLRQMERNHANILVVGTFAATNCTLAQLRTFFATKDKKVISMAEIEEIISHALPVL